MSNMPFNQLTPMSSAPLVHGGVVPTRTSSWPLVIGIIATIIGGLGLVSNGCGAILAPMIHAFTSRVIPPGSNPMMDVQLQIGQQYLWFQILNAVTLSALGILLLAGGIGLIRRRRWSRGALLSWAGVRILYAFPASFIAYRMTMDMMQAMETASASGTAGAPPMPQGFSGFMQVFGAVGIAIGIVVVCAFPLFTIIWFSRRAIRNEMASWQ